MRAWRACCTAASAAALLLGGMVPAQGGIILNTQGPGSAAVVYEGPTLFLNPSVFSTTEKDTIVEKTFTALGTLVFDNVEFAAADTDFEGGFRWTERIHNDTAVAWTSFEFVLAETAGTFFTDLPKFSPTLGVINGGGAILSSSTNTIVRDASLGTHVLSADGRTLTFTFAGAVAPGSFFDVHVPIENLGTTTSFELRQTPNAASSVVPLPRAGLQFTLCALPALAAFWLRRRSRRHSVAELGSTSR